MAKKERLERLLKQLEKLSAELEEFARELERIQGMPHRQRPRRQAGRKKKRQE